MPTYAELNVRINQLVTERDKEWCGLPMPLPGCGLVVEDRHPHKSQIADLQRVIDRDSTAAPVADDLTHQGWRVVNRWHGRTVHGLIGQIMILRHEDGRTTWGLDPDAPKRNRMLFGPFDTYQAWHIDTECTAIDKLATLISEPMFRAYVLTGGFLETSKRSGLTYFFRRCRPTVVMTPHKKGDDMHVLACLCLHPIAYYANTFGGAMVPTDDVISHLLLMRGDEAMLWRRANQHHPSALESGL